MLEIELFWHLTLRKQNLYSCLTELFKIKQFICIKMDLSLNNLQRLICHKTQTKKKQQANKPNNTDFIFMQKTIKIFFLIFLKILLIHWITLTHTHTHTHTHIHIYIYIYIYISIYIYIYIYIYTQSWPEKFKITLNCQLTNSIKLSIVLIKTNSIYQCPTLRCW